MLFYYSVSDNSLVNVEFTHIKRKYRSDNVLRTNKDIFIVNGEFTLVAKKFRATKNHT